MRMFQPCIEPKSKGYLKRISSLAVALSCSWALLPATAVSEDTGLGQPQTLAPGGRRHLLSKGRWLSRAH